MIEGRDVRPTKGGTSSAPIWLEIDGHLHCVTPTAVTGAGVYSYDPFCPHAPRILTSEPQPNAAADGDVDGRVLCNHCAILAHKCGLDVPGWDRWTVHGHAGYALRRRGRGLDLAECQAVAAHLNAALATCPGCDQQVNRDVIDADGYCPGCHEARAQDDAEEAEELEDSLRWDAGTPVGTRGD